MNKLLSTRINWRLLQITAQLTGMISGLATLATMFAAPILCWPFLIQALTDFWGPAISQGTHVADPELHLGIALFFFYSFMVASIVLFALYMRNISKKLPC